LIIAPMQSSGKYERHAWMFPAERWSPLEEVCSVLSVVA
jgi:hypothetical protein